MVESDAQAFPQRRFNWGLFLVIVSFVMFVITATIFVRGFFANDSVYYHPPRVRVTDGAIRVRLAQYGVAASRGAITFDMGRDGFANDGVIAHQGWYRYSVPARSHILPPSPNDRSNIRFAGFQWYHGRFVVLDPNYGLERTTYRVVIPLWPLLLISAILPIRWWRRRRQRGGRGFPVTLNAQHP